jgi:AbrB family looped-hinge helix DNA binding protein
MLVSTLTTKYQATIPRAVRETLALGAGDRVEWLISAGEVRVRRAPARPADPYLAAIEGTLAPEWASDDDEQAYGQL